MKDSITNILGNCSNSKCNCKLKSEAFIELFENMAFIFDDKLDSEMTPCYLVSESEKYHFKVTNLNTVPFSFVKVDACLVTDHSTRCDCIIYSEKEFYFIEIKDVKKNGRSLAKKHAYKQLESTILRLKELNFQNRSVFAVVGFSKPIMQVVSCSSNIQKVRFRDVYNVSLLEGQEIRIN